MKYIEKLRSYRGSIALSAVVLFISVAASSAWAGESGQAETWGDGTSVIQYDRFFIAGQPDVQALEEALENDVDVVINLRGESEIDWDEQAAAESLDLSYFQVSVNSRGSSLAREPFDRISEIVQANPDARIMVHCGSGNRAAAWLAVYLSEIEGMTAEDAMAVAKSSGLSSEKLEEKVRVYLEP